jgi:hypothetical protein
MCKSSVKEQITKITDTLKRMVNTATVIISDRKFRKPQSVPLSPLQYVTLKTAVILSETFYRGIASKVQAFLTLLMSKVWVFQSGV